MEVLNKIYGSRWLGKPPQNFSFSLVRAILHLLRTNSKIKSVCVCVCVRVRVHVHMGLGVCAATRPCGSLALENGQLKLRYDVAINHPLDFKD